MAINAYVEALQYPAEACGVIAAIDGRFVALDLFDKAGTMQQVWPRLVTGYAMDAISRRASAKASGKSKTFTAKGAGALLEHLGQVPCIACPSVGMGDDWRFEAPDILGQALIVPAEESDVPTAAVPQVCIHLSAFPNDPRTNAPDPGHAILPPSCRRPRRGGNPPDGEIVY